MNLVKLSKKISYRQWYRCPLAHGTSAFTKQKTILLPETVLFSPPYVYVHVESQQFGKGCFSVIFAN